MTDNNQAPAADPTVPVAPTPAPRKTRAWLTPVLGVVAALVIGLFGGILIGHATAPAASARAGGGTGFNRPFGGGAGQEGAGGGAGTGANGGAGAGGGGFAGGGFTAGTIVSVNGDTIVIKQTNGTQTTVTTTGTTTVTKTAKSSVSALKAGETITVIGQADSSGAITARSVSEGATAVGGRFGAGRPGGTAAPGATAGTGN